MGLKISECFASKYFKGSDFKTPRVLRIAKAAQEIIGQDKELKVVVSFDDEEKQLPLNQTNGLTLQALFGDDCDSFAGHHVELYAEKVSFQGRITDGVRIREPRQPAADRHAASQDDPDDAREPDAEGAY